MAVLEAKGLTVQLPPSADRPFAVEDITLKVDAGEILCIVGESGSGKSVTAFSVMGLADKRALTPVAGTISLEGEDLLTASDERLRKLRGEKMAMIFQEPMTALNPVLRVGDQIGEMLEIHTDLSTSARKVKVIEAMRDVNLPDPEKMYRSYPHQLSGGQRQRIMIAMALTLEPQLLIADEPTTALDVTTQAQILSLVKDIQRRKGMGVIFITHDFGVVAEIADRVAVMKHGRIVEHGTVAEVLGAPKDPYTQQLIAAVPSMTPPERAEAQGAVALETQDLVKTYGQQGLFGTGRVVKAAQDVDLTVRRGETLGIVGESGSGKSTVARCVMRLIDPTSGAILIDGENIASLREGQLRPHRRDIQIVFQDPYRSLNPRRTVGQSIVEGPVNFGLSMVEAKSRAADLMKVVGLSADALERFPHQFSGGQRQRICIARALAMEPAILIADEAVSALDVSVQAQVLDLLDDVRKRFDLAMLFITHDLRVAAQICDRIVVMNKGQVVETGPTASVYANPSHSYTQALLAAAPGKQDLSG
ncbi:ABC transporter ATP-binding protein [uncultured Roseobacter sp.]|uniref:ABC transporter ATP-binding protein n=1 Tax=uncultured Roseobacter sp. TaxID=114847 RepID=UPI0026132A51|nr:ABC transporter ATP-binding protein [uncultured Roseobacter sp.]